MWHSPDLGKKVTVKVFGYMKTGAKCVKAGGKETQINKYTGKKPVETRWE